MNTSGQDAVLSRRKEEEELFIAQARKVIELESGKRVGPFNLQFNPTNLCNQKCRFCWLRDEKNQEKQGIDRQELPDEKYIRIIEDAGRLGVKRITITGGGEPTIRKSLLEAIIPRIKSEGMEGTIITNGTLLDQRLADVMVKSRWDSVIFSLDSPDPETNDFLRGMKGGFEKTVSSIRMLDKAKRKGGSMLPKLCIHYVLTNRNHTQIAEMVHLISDLNVENFFIEPVVNLCETSDLGESLKLKDAEQKKIAARHLKEGHELCDAKSIENNLHLLKEELIASVNDMKRHLEQERKKNTHIAEPGNGIAGTICYEPSLNMIIRPNGTVGPCCMFDFQSLSIKDKTLEEIWFGETFQKIREQIKKGELPGRCSNCNPGQVINNQRIRKHILNEEKARTAVNSDRENQGKAGFISRIKGAMRTLNGRK